MNTYWTGCTLDQKLMEHITNKPGTTIQGIRKQLGIERDYVHFIRNRLQRLEGQNMIYSKWGGGTKKYFTGTPQENENGRTINVSKVDLEEKVYRFIVETKSELGETFGRIRTYIGLNAPDLKVILKDLEYKSKIYCDADTGRYLIRKTLDTLKEKPVLLSEKDRLDENKILNYIDQHEGASPSILQSRLRMEYTQIFPLLRFMELEGLIHSRYKGQTRQLFLGPNPFLVEDKILKFIKENDGVSLSDIGKAVGIRSVDQDTTLREYIGRLEVQGRIGSNKIKPKLYFHTEQTVHNAPRFIEFAQSVPVGIREALAHPIRSFSDRMTWKDPLTIRELAYAICEAMEVKKVSMKIEDAAEIAFKVLELFGYNDYLSDNFVRAYGIQRETADKIRGIFYDLEDLGILTTEKILVKMEGKNENRIREDMKRRLRRDVPFQGEDFRIPWWVILKSKTRELAEAYITRIERLAEAHIETDIDNTYDILGKDVWERDQ